LPGARVAQIRLLRTAARVGEVDAHHSALRLFDFFAAVVAYQPRNTCHGFPPQFDELFPSSLSHSLRNHAAARACRIFQERRRLKRACSSRSSPASRALTTRKWRGRKSSIVLPSRYWSITAGLTYELRATAGVFPSF